MNAAPVVHVGLTDHYDPEVRAMLMAMYSRNKVAIETRLPSTNEALQTTKEKLGKFYVGYNHKSVGQLAVTDVYIEGVSMLAAKAIEDTPLFNGQEPSTRYMDFATQPMIAPSKAIAEWQQKWIDFYLRAIPLVQEKIKKEYPLEDQVELINQAQIDPEHTMLTNLYINGLLCFTYKRHDYGDGSSALEMTSTNVATAPKVYFKTEKELLDHVRIRTQENLCTSWENTVKARAFDICRGFLPAGITTNVGFSGTFDTINEHFGQMLKHPCIEMQDIAAGVLSELAETYQYACLPMETHARNNEHVGYSHFYQNVEYNERADDAPVTVYVDEKTVNNDLFDLLASRKKFQRIPRVYSGAFNVKLAGVIDYGSFRDLQRHRPGFLNMPLLTNEVGFEAFYLDNMPTELKFEMFSLLDAFNTWYNFNSDDVSAVDKQYATPMGYKVNVQYSCDLNQALYICELRSGKTVHQTLRTLVHKWVKGLAEETTYGVRIHADMDVDNFTLERGGQAGVAG